MRCIQSGALLTSGVYVSAIYTPLTRFATCFHISGYSNLDSTRDFLLLAFTPPPLLPGLPALLVALLTYAAQNLPRWSLPLNSKRSSVPDARASAGNARGKANGEEKAHEEPKAEDADDPGMMHLEQLFNKTEALPNIFWKPLTDEEVEV